MGRAAIPLASGARLFCDARMSEPSSANPPAIPADKLEAIFALQAALNRRIGVDTAALDEAGQVQWTLNYVRAMQQELAELTDSVPWKWWAKYQKFDRQNARVEVVDLFHFLVSIAQTLGLSADDIYQAYLKKNQINHQRQDSGYVKKDENDSKGV
jgi:dimeric dUTPase (all-alpha-NTP-PPase superfamily)